MSEWGRPRVHFLESGQTRPSSDARPTSVNPSERQPKRNQLYINILHSVQRSVSSIPRPLPGRQGNIQRPIPAPSARRSLTSEEIFNKGLVTVIPGVIRRTRRPAEEGVNNDGCPRRLEIFLGKPRSHVPGELSEEKLMKITKHAHDIATNKQKIGILIHIKKSRKNPANVQKISSKLENMSLNDIDQPEVPREEAVQEANDNERNASELVTYIPPEEGDIVRSKI